MFTQIFCGNMGSLLIQYNILLYQYIYINQWKTILPTYVSTLQNELEIYNSKRFPTT